MMPPFESENAEDQNDSPSTPEGNATPTLSMSASCTFSTRNENHTQASSNFRCIIFTSFFSQLHLVIFCYSQISLVGSLERTPYAFLQLMVTKTVGEFGITFANSPCTSRRLILPVAHRLRWRPVKEWIFARPVVPNQIRHAKDIFHRFVTRIVYLTTSATF